MATPHMQYTTRRRGYLQCWPHHTCDTGQGEEDTSSVGHTTHAIQDKEKRIPPVLATPHMRYRTRRRGYLQCWPHHTCDTGQGEEDNSTIGHTTHAIQDKEKRIPPVLATPHMRYRTRRRGYLQCWPHHTCDTGQGEEDTSSVGHTTHAIQDKEKRITPLLATPHMRYRTRRRGYLQCWPHHTCDTGQGEEDTSSVGHTTHAIQDKEKRIPPVLATPYRRYRTRRRG